MEVRSSEQIIQDVELRTLAKQIEPSHFEDLGLHLGFKHAELSNIRSKNQLDIQAAITETLCLWRDWQVRQIDQRETLAEKLSGIDLSALGQKLVQGKLHTKQYTCLHTVLASPQNSLILERR